MTNHLLFPLPTIALATVSLFSLFNWYTRNSFSLENKKTKKKEYSWNALQDENGPWLLLAGWVFDLSTDLDGCFTLPNGIYAQWSRQDITSSLYHVIQERPSENTSHHPDLSSIEIQQEIQRWYHWCIARYPCMGIVTDRYHTIIWQKFRAACEDQPDTVLRCPLGFGSSKKETVKGSQEWTLMELENEPYISIHGRVFDVESIAWDANFRGADLSFLVSKASADMTTLANHSLTSQALTFTEQKRVHTLSQYLQDTCPSMGWLTPSDGKKLFGEQWTAEPSSDSSEDGNTLDLHCAVEEGNVGKVRELLLEESDIVYIVDTVCPRSGLSLLHKSIERGQLEMVDLLLQHGADPTKPAALYGNDTALDLAQRFHHEHIIQHLEEYLF